MRIYVYIYKYAERTARARVLGVDITHVWNMPRASVQARMISENEF